MVVGGRETFAKYSPFFSFLEYIYLGIYSTDKRLAKQSHKQYKVTGITFLADFFWRVCLWWWKNLELVNYENKRVSAHSYFFCKQSSYKNTSCKHQTLTIVQTRQG